MVPNRAAHHICGNLNLQSRVFSITIFVLICSWIVIDTSFHLRIICITVFCFIIWYSWRVISVGIHLRRCRGLWRYFHLIRACIISMLRDWIRIAVIILSRLRRGLFIDTNLGITAVIVFRFMNFISITTGRFARLLWPFSDTEITKVNIMVLLIIMLNWIHQVFSFKIFFNLTITTLTIPRDYCKSTVKLGVLMYLSGLVVCNEWMLFGSSSTLSVDFLIKDRGVFRTIKNI